MTLKIVLADNDVDFLETYSLHLRRTGYTVHSAGSAAETRHILEQEWIHIAVLDKRLEDNQDEGDISGIDLARDAQYQTIPKIILTAHPEDWRHVRDALSTQHRDFKPAVHFLSKEEGAEALIKAIEETANTFLNINWSLKTHWRTQGLSYIGLAEQLTPSGETSQLIDRAAELEDLFCMLFSVYSQITIERLLWQQAGRVALVICAFNEGMPGRQLVVTVGQKAALQSERQNLSKLDAVGTVAGIPTLIDSRRTLNYAANAYELPSSDLETVKTLTEVYRQSNTREVKSTLQNLSSSNTSVWHGRRRFAPQQDLGALLRQRLRLDPHEQIAACLAKQIEHIGRNAEMNAVATITRTSEALQIDLARPRESSLSYPDPVSWLSEGLPVMPETPIMLATTLGELRAESILVDNDGHVWLSDFGDLQEGLILADFAALEASLKFDLTQGESLCDLHECEKLLMAPERLTSRGESGPVPLQKAMAAVRVVRSLAASVGVDDMKQYLLALAYYTVKRILAYDANTGRTQKDVISAIHACLSLGIILNRLAELNPQMKSASALSPHRSGLQVDETNRRIIVDGRDARLTPYGYQLIHCLWQREGQLCSREELYEAVYNQPYQQGRTRSEDDQLNVLVGRVRKAIEADPSRPKYLITRRSEGYTLFPQGKPDG